MPRFEMDDSEESEVRSVNWWEFLDDTSSFVRFHYDDIMQHGSDELKNAVNIVLGGNLPGIYKKEA